LAVGAAVGAALLSKYTALFFGVAILIWLLAVLAAALADHAMPLISAGSSRWRSLRPSSSGTPPPVGVLMKQFGARASRFSSGLHRRTGSDPDRVRKRPWFHSRRDGASCAGMAQRRRAAGAPADRRDVLDHRRLFRLAPLHARVEANWFAPSIRRLWSRPPSPPIACPGRYVRGVSPIFACNGAAPVGVLMLRF